MVRQVEPRATEGRTEGIGKHASRLIVIFADQACGACHTLADAGTNGTTGPNPDQSQPSLERGLQIITTDGGPTPAFGNDGTLTEQQVLDVASYVVSVTS